MNKIPFAHCYRYFEPRPIIFIATYDGESNNVMTASLYDTISEQPLTLAINLGPWDRTLDIIQQTKQAIIAIPGADLLETMVKIGNSTGIDKFKKFKLETAPATHVDAPLIPACIANFEAKYAPDESLESYGLYKFEIISGYRNPKPADPRTIHHNGDGTFTLSGETLDLKHLMTRYPEYTA